LDSIASEIRRKEGIQITLDDVRAILTFVFAEIFDERQITNFLKKKHDAGLFEYLELTAKHYRSSKDLGSIGYLRTNFTSELVGQFLGGVRFQENRNFPAMSHAYLEDDIKVIVETLKRFTYLALIRSPRLKISEQRGKEIVIDIFTALSEADGHTLLPKDFQSWFLRSKSTAAQKRVICDFVAGMTDRYAVEFHSRLKSESPESIFKPM
jgi:dGTPase